MQTPPEAVQSGLGGRVSVEVEVEKTGTARSGKGAYGPDFVCPSIKRPDVLALREAAPGLAKEVKFAPAEKGSTEWVSINFPLKKPDDAKDGTWVAPEGAPPAGGGDGERDSAKTQNNLGRRDQWEGEDSGKAPLSP